MSIPFSSLKLPNTTTGHSEIIISNKKQIKAVDDKEGSPLSFKPGQLYKTRNPMYFFEGRPSSIDDPEPRPETVNLMTGTILMFLETEIYKIGPPTWRAGRISFLGPKGVVLWDSFRVQQENGVSYGPPRRFMDQFKRI